MFLLSTLNFSLVHHLPFLPVSNLSPVPAIGHSGQIPYVKAKPAYKKTLYRSVPAYETDLSRPATSCMATRSVSSEFTIRWTMRCHTFAEGWAFWVSAANAQPINRSKSSRSISRDARMAVPPLAFTNKNFSLDLIQQHKYNGGRTNTKMRVPCLR